jgi:hypothetical protein
MVRALEPGEVSAAVRGWLTGQGYGAVTDGAPPERLTGGADFWVYGLRFAGPGLPPRWSAPLVARVPAAAARYDMLQQDSAVQCWAAARGYPAPEVLTVLAPGKALPSPVGFAREPRGQPTAIRMCGWSAGFSHPSTASSSALGRATQPSVYPSGMSSWRKMPAPLSGGVGILMSMKCW